MKLTVILSLVTFCSFGQQFPTVIDTIAQIDLFTTSRMIAGGFELIGVSKDYAKFDLSNVHQLHEDHIHRIISKNDEYEIIFADSTIEEIDIPPTKQPPPPPPPLPNTIKKYKLGEHLRIRVDTSQVVSIPDYTDNLSVNLNDGKTVEEIYKSELDFLSKYYKPSTKMVEGYPVLIENISDSVRNIETQEGWLYMIQEAMDEHGTWLPIEYIDYRAVCGNSFGYTELLPNEYLLSKIYKYSGNFQTKLRIRFSTFKEVYISNEFSGRINISQFEPHKYLSNQIELLNEYFLKN